LDKIFLPAIGKKILITLKYIEKKIKNLIKSFVGRKNRRSVFLVGLAARFYNNRLVFSSPLSAFCFHAPFNEVISLSAYIEQSHFRLLCKICDFIKA